MPRTLVFTPAQPDQVAAIRQLLQDAELPADDFSAHLEHFLVAGGPDGALLGVVGLEAYARFGLLRSLAVAAAHRRQGIGQQLCQRMVAYARELGLQELYLLTTTAADFFSKLGFKQMGRGTVPAPIQATREFASICPATAVCMVKHIENRKSNAP